MLRFLVLFSFYFLGSPLFGYDYAGSVGVADMFADLEDCGIKLKKPAGRVYSSVGEMLRSELRSTPHTPPTARKQERPADVVAQFPFEQEIAPGITEKTHTVKCYHANFPEGRKRQVKTHTYTMEAAIRRQEQDPEWQLEQKMLQEEAKRAPQQTIHHFMIEHALNHRHGCMSGFSDANKALIREKLSGLYTWYWQEKLLSFYSPGGVMSGFTEENKIRILSALRAVCAKTEDSDTFLSKFLSHFDHNGEWLTWSEERKVGIIEEIHSPMPATITQTEFTQPTSGMEEID